METRDIERLVSEYLDAMEHYYRMYCTKKYERICMIISYYLLREDELRKYLVELAKSYGDCVSCKYSTPVPFHPTPEARFCLFGLRQDDCNKYTPLI